MGSEQTAEVPVGQPGSFSTVESHGFSLYPFRELGDWVSVADAIAVFEVDSETEEEVDPSETGTSEVIEIRREVSVSVTQLLRQYPDGVEFPMAFSMPVSGSSVGDDGDVRDITGEGARIEVGNTYVAAFVISGNSWDFQTPSSVFAVDDGVIVADPGDVLIRAELSGMTVDELAAALAELSPPARVLALEDSTALSRTEALMGPGE